MKTTLAGIAVAGLLLAGCASSLTGRYQANYKKRTYLRFEADQKVYLEDLRGSLVGRYTRQGDIVTVHFDRVWIAERKRASFRVDGDELRAIADPGDTVFPMGHALVRVP